jgi:hypothetical protein
MKKTLLMTGVLLAMTASIASAGISLSWNDCAVEAAVVNKNFACNTNGANHDMFIALDPPPSVTATNGHNSFIDLQSASPTLPAWWDLKNTGSCRATSLLGSGDFSTAAPSGGFGACQDPWQGVGSGSIPGYNLNFGGPNRVRMVTGISVSGFSSAMNQGTQYYSMKVRINSAKTVGTGACAGCDVPVCLVLNLVRIAQLPGTPGGDIDVVDPHTTGNWVTWQGGDVGGIGCPGVVPVKNTTWGKVKSLYR